MLFEVTQFSVNRNEVLGLNELQQQLHLLLAGMPGHVHGGDGVVDHLGAAVEQPVDGAVHHLLIARDRV